MSLLKIVRNITREVGLEAARKLLWKKLYRRAREYNLTESLELHVLTRIEQLVVRPPF